MSTDLKPEQAQALILCVPVENYGADDEVLLEDLEGVIVEAVEGGGLGWCDGDERGPDQVRLWAIGPDAEALRSALVAALGNTELPAGTHLLVRSGPAGTAEVRVELSAG